MKARVVALKGKASAASATSTKKSKSAKKTKGARGAGTASLAVVPVVEGAFAKSGRAKSSAVLGAAAPTVARAVELAGFTGRANECLTVMLDGAPADVLLVVGCGKSPTADALRRGLGTAVRRIPSGARGKSASLLVDVANPLAESLSKKASPSVALTDLVQAAVEGWILGAYENLAHQTQKKAKKLPILEVTLGGADSKTVDSKTLSAAKSAASAGEIVADGVILARELANAPANVIEPVSLAKKAREVARSSGLTCRVLDEAAVRREKMGALIAVAQGSALPPRFIILKYTPGGRAASKKPLVLVGKAVTFDSGGISIKPAKGMEEMKGDMSGGAAVIGAMQAIGRLKPRYPVVGLVPAAENMVSGEAIKPGDVVTSRSGLTIEIVNTDAEGRLILADALNYARGLKPRLAVDLATLTGACVIALGDVTSGAMSNDDEAMAAVAAAAERSGERVWRLPLHREYFDQIRSDTADIKNSGGRPAGAITAGAFLGKFVEDMPWVHLDIAGTAWSTRTRGHETRGLTGVGVRTLVELARQFAAE